MVQQEPARTGLTFDPERHAYTLDGHPVPSVTQILQPLRGDLAAIPPNILERKRQIGTAVHVACELYDLGDLVEDSVHEVVQPYLEAWKRFRAEQPFEILEVERKVAHRSLRYAGTLDRFGLWAYPTGQKPRCVIDIKTSDDFHDAYGVQLVAYAAADPVGVDGQPCPRRAPPTPEGIERRAVLLGNDGKYRVKQYSNPSDWSCFMALLGVYQWSQSCQK